MLAAMRQYQLAEIYTNLRRALTAGREAEAARWLGEVLGVELPSRLPASVARLKLEPMLTYRGFKPAELAMLAADVKPVVKFEDLPIELAAEFTARHGEHYQIEASAPYRKDYLLLRSRPLPPGTPGPDRLVALYVSRDDAASRLRRLEATAREDFAGSGALLGFPPCCVAAFAADFESSRRDQDTLNDDACRRVLTSARPGLPALNPLSDLELLGFYPCRLDCPQALAIAKRNVDALLRTRPTLLPVLRERLARPVLFWRLPFFATLPGQLEGDALVYGADAANPQQDQARVNAFPDPAVRRVQAFFAAHLGAWLAGGDRLSVTGQGLEIRHGDRLVRTVPMQPRDAPVVVTWRTWPEKFFDPGAGPAQPIPRTT